MADHRGCYAQVNQGFLGFLAVTEDLGSDTTIRGGFRTVRSDWWQVLGLLVLRGLILLLGVVACGFGLLAAIPLAACSTAAAYQSCSEPAEKLAVNDAIISAMSGLQS